MPGTHVALIRGINVGRAKRVAMADLRGLLEGLGCRQVQSLLNSGNLVFTAAHEKPERLGARIQRAMLDGLGVSARVLVLTRAAYAAAVRENALSAEAADPARLLVAFSLDTERLERLWPLVDRDWSPEKLAVGTVAAYVWCPGGILASRLLEAVGRTLGDSMTTRNWATVTRIDEALRSEPGGAAGASRPARRRR